MLPIHSLASEAEAEACARMMVTSDPWKTLGATYEHCLTVIRAPQQEVYVAADAEPAGFIIVIMTGAFTGYIRIVCVAAEHRGSGLGTALIRFAEERIFRDSPNVFLCVSSFNTRARALYERLGYEAVGELKDYLVRGASEILMRKTVGPILEARQLTTNH
jgi:ribosomal protein S18 acetylase RimI-like enzyme